jgi:hypothetical protein
MKAMTRSVYGSADVLEFVEMETPAPADDEVLIRVRAAGAGPEVWHLMTGLPYLVRIMGFGLRKPLWAVLPRCRGAAGRAWHQRRSRHRVPVGADVHGGVHRRRETRPACCW